MPAEHTRDKAKSVARLRPRCVLSWLHTTQPQEGAEFVSIRDVERDGCGDRQGTEREVGRASTSLRSSKSNPSDCSDQLIAMSDSLVLTPDNSDLAELATAPQTLPGAPSSGRLEVVPATTGGRDTPPRRVVTKKQLWTTEELSTIAELARRHRSANGNIMWSQVLSEWNQRQMPARTIAAMKAAHAKLVRCITNIDATAAARMTPGKGAEADVRPEEAVTGLKRPKPQDNEERNGHTTPKQRAETDAQKERLRKHFRQLYKKAEVTRKRRPIKKVQSKVPMSLLQLGDEILREHLNRKGRRMNTLSALNAATYAISAAITREVNRSSKAESKARLIEQEIREAQELRSAMIRIISTLENELMRREQNRDEQQFLQPSKRYLELRQTFGLHDTELIRIKTKRLKEEYHIIERDIERLETWQRGLQAGNWQKLKRQQRDQEENLEIAIEDIRDYWQAIVGIKRPFTVSSELKAWAVEMKTTKQAQSNDQTLPVQIEQADWQKLWTNVKAWKAPGPDGLQAYWWKNLAYARHRLQKWCEIAVNGGEHHIPPWLPQARVVLIPKKRKQDRLGPGDYRPIACLNTCYKVITEMLAIQIAKVTEHRMPEEQLALKKGTWGCTHAHVLDQTVIKDAKLHNRELHMLWIDMTKAYDSISHKALKWTLRQWDIHPAIKQLLAKLIRRQSVYYLGQQNGNRVHSRPITIRNGLMQGDVLSPLLFTLVIAPISHWLRNNIQPYKTSTREVSLKLGHILYMDDLKVYTPTWDQLAKAKQGIEEVAKQLGLTVNPLKSAIKSMNHISADQTGQRTPKEIGQIPILGTLGHYKYLGIEQNTLVNSEQLWERTVAAATRTCQEILQSEWLTRQKIAAINTIVMPKIRYTSSCIIFGEDKLVSTMKRMRDLDAIIREMMTDAKIRFAHSCTPRLYVDVQYGGIGLRTAEEEVEQSITYTWCYVATNSHLTASFQLAEALRKRGKRSLDSDFQAITVANRLESRISRTETGQVLVDAQSYTNPTAAARAIKRLIHDNWQKHYQEEWKKRGTASRILKPLSTLDNKTYLSLKDSFMWLDKGLIPVQTARNIMAVQEGTLITRAHPALSARHICLDSAPCLKHKCRMGCEQSETAQHIVSACSHWRTNLMIDRHDRIVDILLTALKQKWGWNKEQITENEHISNNGNITIYRDTPITTIQYIRHNKPDIVLWDKGSRTVQIIEVAVTWFTRIPEMERLKTHKYATNSNLPQGIQADQFTHGPNLKQALETERKCRVEVVPIIIGTGGECTTTLRKNINRLGLTNCKSIIERITRAAVIGSDRIIRCHLSQPQ